MAGAGHHGNCTVKRSMSYFFRFSVQMAHAETTTATSCGSVNEKQTLAYIPTTSNEDWSLESLLLSSVVM